MSNERVYNFSAGPSTLPVSVLQRCADEMLNYKGSGQSVMEMSHRSKVYDDIIVAVQANLRKVMNIPDNYKVLFLQGGASTQFAMVPMNLMTKNGIADYAVTGRFARSAYKEAKKYGDARCAFNGEENNFTTLPKQEELQLSADADYFHMCENNTIYGTKWQYVPQTLNNIPIVSDMSSCILSYPADVTKYGLIYAGAQKNMAPAGLTVVIIREDLIGEPMPFTPTMLNYGVMAESDSMHNTPPCYCIYVLGLVLEWIEGLGGLTAMQKINEEKAALLYNFLDESKLFTPVANKANRSIMNVTFVSPDKDTDALFVKEATAAGFVNLKGHKSVGGMRASIYNAMPTEGVAKLVEFMKKFEMDHK